jgi:hypothetical protein
VVKSARSIRVKRPYRKRQPEAVYDPDTACETEHEHQLQLKNFDLNLALRKTEWKVEDLMIDLLEYKREQFIRLMIIIFLIGSYPLVAVLCWMAFSAGPVM